MKQKPSSKQFSDSQFRIWFDVKAADDWTDDDRLRLTRVKFRASVNRPKLLKMEEMPHGPGMRVLSSCVRAADRIDGMKKWAFVFEFAQTAGRLQRVYELFFPQLGSAEFVKIVLDLSKTDGIFDAFVSCERMLMSARPGQMPDVFKLIPAEHVEAVGFLCEGLRKCLAGLNSTILTSIRASVKGAHCDASGAGFGIGERWRGQHQGRGHDQTF
jgi:hypothetical protein